MLCAAGFLWRGCPGELCEPAVLNKARLRGREIAGITRTFFQFHNVNQTLDEAGRVRSFVLMHKEFDADEEEMTRSRKLKRNVLADKYSDIIDAMYDGRDHVNVKAVVAYQDGSEGIVETDVRIMAL